MGLWAWIKARFFRWTRTVDLRSRFLPPTVEGKPPQRQPLGNIFTAATREVAEVPPLHRPIKEALLSLEGSDVYRSAGEATFGWNSQPLISMDAAVLEWGFEGTRSVVGCCAEWINDPDQESAYELSRSPLIQKGSRLDLVQYRSRRVARPAHRRMTDLSRAWLPEGCGPFLLREVDLTTGWLWALMLFAGKENLFVTTIYFSRMPGTPVERAQHIPGHPQQVLLETTWEIIQATVSDVFRSLEVTAFLELRRPEASSRGSLRALDQFVERVLRELRYPPLERRMMWRGEEPRASAGARVG
jgi:hypothetical protein